MKNATPLIAIEFFLLFIILPVFLAIDITPWFKVPLVLMGFIYLLVMLKRSGNLTFKLREQLDWRSFWKRVGVTLIGVILFTTLYVWYTKPSALFYVPLHKPLLFVIILMVYTFLSVWPQEVIYRTFFFERYTSFFPNQSLLILVNAIVFSLAHLFFRNTLVLILTFIGGLLFGWTYLKFKSTTLVSIEHAIYGNWLFTVGMGEMLAFPGMDS